MNNKTFISVIKNATENAFAYNRFTMTSEQKFILANASGELRERLIIEARPELKNNDHKHGYDAKCLLTGRPVEIKSETIQGVGVTSNMSGKATWGTTTDEEKIQSHIDNDVIIYQTGWCKETGKCGYILKFDYKKTNFADAMLKGVRGSKKTAPKTSYQDIGDAKVEVLHFDPRIDSQMTKKFAEYVYHKLTREDMIKVIKALR